MKKPNVVYILADDLGYGDVSALNENSAFKTPNLDALCANGIKFTDAHASSAVCTPSRYSILTGRYNWRSRLKAGVMSGYSPALIEEGRPTVADFLRAQGYRTAAIGKWHLGMNFTTDDSFVFQDDYETCEGVDYGGPISRSPITNGFDYFFGISASLDMAPYIYIENDRFTNLPDHETEGFGKRFWRKGPTGPDFRHEDVLDVLTDKVIEKIEEFRNDPFFVYFPLPAPHTPILPSSDFAGRSGTNEYGDFVLMCDDVVGRIGRVLADLGLSDNTMVVFASDNGCSPLADFGELLAAGHNPSYVFRGHKADIYEGGHRIPLLIQWPDFIPANRTCDQIVCLSDLFATMADFFSVDLPDDVAEDSVSNLAFLRGETDKSLRTDVIHQSMDGSLSIRQGSYKLEMCPGSGGWSYPAPGEETDDMPRFQLYDLAEDISERNNVIAAHPEIFEELRALLISRIVDGRSTTGKFQKNQGEQIWGAVQWLKEFVVDGSV